MIKFKIATPERVMLETEVDSVTLPTTLGEITVLRNHIPLVANLVAGEVKYKTSGKDEFFAVSGGVIEVKPDHSDASVGASEVVVLADTAEFPHEIDVARAEEGRIRAEKLMSESQKDQKSFASATALLEKHLTRIKIAKKHRTHTHTRIEN
ncbi:MAG: ATP synthase F1 subunit epsilon [bacterium]|nr:ATP synthase F1 subunit epsilon [bacterium]